MNASNSQWFPTTDESTDVGNTVQLAVLVRGIDRYECSTTQPTSIRCHRPRCTELEPSATRKVSHEKQNYSASRSHRTATVTGKPVALSVHLVEKFHVQRFRYYRPSCPL